MLFLLLVTLCPLVVRTSLIPEMATIESCTNWNILVTDRNVRRAIEFFRSCRNLGLTMGDLLPEDYMKTLATNLKTSNYQFLQQSTFAQPKLRMFEREFNDLYQEITILSEKVVGRYRSHDGHDKKCTCSLRTTTRPTTTTLSTLGPNFNQDDSNKMDPYDYDYGSSINPCSEAAFYIYLLVIVFVSLLISLWTCRLASKTYKLLKDSQLLLQRLLDKSPKHPINYKSEDDELYSHSKGGSR